MFLVKKNLGFFLPTIRQVWSKTRCCICFVYFFYSFFRSVFIFFFSFCSYVAQQQNHTSTEIIAQSKVIKIRSFETEIVYVSLNMNLSKVWKLYVFVYKWISFIAIAISFSHQEIPSPSHKNHWYFIRFRFWFLVFVINLVNDTL